MYIFQQRAEKYIKVKESMKTSVTLFGGNGDNKKLRVIVNMMPKISIHEQGLRLPSKEEYSRSKILRSIARLNTRRSQILIDI